MAGRIGARKHAVLWTATPGHDKSPIAPLGSPRVMPGQPRNWALPLIVMPGLVPGIHVLRPCNSKDVDGRDIGVRKHAVLWTAMPGHDAEGVACASVQPPVFHVQLSNSHARHHPYCLARPRVGPSSR